MGLFKADRIVIGHDPQAPGTAPPAPGSQPMVVIQQQSDPGISTQNGKRYMSALLATSYLAGKLITPTGQAHLLSGATDQQLLEDYRNGDVSSSVLTLYGIPIPKGMTQLKQSPIMVSPEFPPIATNSNPVQVVVAGGSWTFTVPQGWGYTLDTSAPTANVTAPPSPSSPQNVLFSVDAVRSTRTQRSDGGWDVTVYGEWTVVAAPAQSVAMVPAGTYSAMILAMLYPLDNPPPST